MGLSFPDELPPGLEYGRSDDRWIEYVLPGSEIITIYDDGVVGIEVDGNGIDFLISKAHIDAIMKKRKEMGWN